MKSFERGFQECGGLVFLIAIVQIYTWYTEGTKQILVIYRININAKCSLIILSILDTKDIRPLKKIIYFAYCNLTSNAKQQNSTVYDRRYLLEHIINADRNFFQQLRTIGLSHYWLNVSKSVRVKHWDKGDVL